jgi:hypothetical protein
VVTNTRSNNVGATILYAIPFVALLPLTPPLPTAIVSKQQKNKAAKKIKRKQQKQQQEEENPWRYFLLPNNKETPRQTTVPSKCSAPTTVL